MSKTECDDACGLTESQAFYRKGIQDRVPCNEGFIITWQRVRRHGDQGCSTTLGNMLSKLEAYYVQIEVLRRQKGRSSYVF
jgi:hypothetical protein